MKITKIKKEEAIGVDPFSTKLMFSLEVIKKMAGFEILDDVEFDELFQKSQSPAGRTLNILFKVYIKFAWLLVGSLIATPFLAIAMIFDLVPSSVPLFSVGVSVVSIFVLLIPFLLFKLIFLLFDNRHKIKPKTPKKKID